MRPAGRDAAGCIAAALVTALALALGSASAQEAEQAFLGFRPGEEVRYAFEREGDRPADRTVHWSITLQEVSESGSEGVFALSYLVVVGGERRAQAIAEASINAYGFPTRVRFGSERETPAGIVGYTVEYLFEGEVFRKELVGANLDHQEIELEDYADVNTSFPRGLYLYTPLDAECAAAFAGLAADDVPDAGTVGASAVEEFCRGRELVFANPGLLNLLIPALWEAGTGSLDFVVLAPTGMRLDLLTGPPAPPGGGLSVGGINLAGLFRGGPDPFDDPDVALQRFALAAASDPEQLELGGRAVDAWRLDPPAPFASVYVDGNGSIVRLDVPDGAPAGGRAWIRRLRPSEF